MNRPNERAPHPVMPGLVGGIDLASTLAASETLQKMMSNAEYWLSFDVASFEELLAKSPSPLRELGVAVALRFSERINGELSTEDLSRAKQELLEELTAELRAGISEGLAALERAVAARDQVPALEADGFKPYEAQSGLSVHALRAMGKSNIHIVGKDDAEKPVTATVGDRLELTATDERGRPLDVPEVESRVGAPIMFKDESEAKKRTVVFLVPGEYVLRVPGRASGARKIIAT